MAKTANKYDPKTLKAMFGEYKTASKTRDDADAAAIRAQRAQSAVVQRIVDLTGTKGPFSVDGNRLVAMVRPSESEVKKLQEKGLPVPDKTYFFRTESGEAIEV